MEGRWV